MLKTTKSITLNGTSTIGGQQVVYLSAVISSEDGGNSNSNQVITSEALYIANKSEVRKDIASFQEKMYEIQDSLVKETPSEKSETE